MTNKSQLIVAAQGRPEKARALLHKILDSFCVFSKASGRYPAIEGLRGIAVLGVFLCHYDVIVRSHLPTSHSVAAVSFIVGRMGTAGVDLFFMLSGFLIYRIVMASQISWAAFVLRRAKRIYPPFLAVFSTVTVASWFLPKLAHHPTSTFHWPVLLMNIAFLPGLVNVEPILGVAWSLSYEWYFYLTLPVLIWWSGMHRWKRSTRLIIAGSLCMSYLLIAYWLPEIASFLHYPIARSHVRLLMFLGGIISAELTNALRMRPERSWRRYERCVLVAMAVGAIFLTALEVLYARSTHSVQITLRFEAVRASVLLVLCPGLLVCCCGFAGRLCRICSYYPLRWLGNISYSYYLIHTLPINAVQVIALRYRLIRVHPHLAYVGLFPVTFLLTVAAGLCLYLFVEKPFSLTHAVPKKIPAPTPAHPLPLMIPMEVGSNDGR